MSTVAGVVKFNLFSTTDVYMYVYHTKRPPCLQYVSLDTDCRAVCLRLLSIDCVIYFIYVAEREKLM